MDCIRERSLQRSCKPVEVWRKRKPYRSKSMVNWPLALTHIPCWEMLRDIEQTFYDHDILMMNVEIMGVIKACSSLLICYFLNSVPWGSRNIIMKWGLKSIAWQGMNLSTSLTKVTVEFLLSISIYTVICIFFGLTTLIQGKNYVIGYKQSFL